MDHMDSVIVFEHADVSEYTVSQCVHASSTTIASEHEVDMPLFVSTLTHPVIKNRSCCSQHMDGAGYVWPCLSLSPIM